MRPRRTNVRLDRLLTLLVATPWRGIVTRESFPAIPILMYHSVAEELDNKVHPYFRTVTSTRTFARQVEWLQSWGFSAITLSEALDLLCDVRCSSALLARKVVMTFDDGFRDFYTAAFPILEQVGFGATVFLATDFIGKPFFTGRECLSAVEVRDLCGRGVEFGSHSATHRRLAELHPEELARELAVSKDVIENTTGREVTVFSYPFRFPAEDHGFVRLLGGLLDECGYRGGVTTTIGRSSGGNDIRFLPRLPVNDCDDEVLLRAKLAGDYDWLRFGQSVRRRSRALVRRWVGA